MKNIDIHGVTNMELIRGGIAEWTGQRTIFTAISMRQKNYSDRTPCAEQPFVSIIFVPILFIALLHNSD